MRRIMLSALCAACVLLMVGSNVVAASRLRETAIFPGTLWCGAGNQASSRDDLGIFPATDRCCRTHDLCPHKIAPFSTKYDLFNSRPHTVLHCDCDQTFRSCLRLDGSSKSQYVGRFFFNQLRSPCFVWTTKPGAATTQHCVQRSWWGGCARYEVTRKGKWRQQPRF